MSEKTLPQTPRLLEDPEQVALVRSLMHHARMCRAVHATYSIGDGTGKSYGPKEHTWDAGPIRLSIEGGHLRYSRHRVVILTATITHAREVGQLLSAIGAVPVWYSPDYHTGRKDGRWIANTETNPDRRCRRCGVRTGLKTVFSGLGYATREWECRDGCTEVTRTGERPAEPGEVCTCGRPAVKVFTGGRFGDTGYCGLPDGGQPGPCPFCGGLRHESERCPRYELRPAGSAS